MRLVVSSNALTLVISRDLLRLVVSSVSLRLGAGVLRLVFERREGDCPTHAPIVSAMPVYEDLGQLGQDEPASG